MLEAMRSRLEPLLAELHAHTRWSDGELTTRELVDLYGRQGFDVLCVTDHVVRTDHPVEGSDGRIEAVSQRDYPVITGVFLVVGVAVMAINLLVDLSYGLLDPRVRPA